MPSQYLQSADYAAYGLATATAQQVTQASVLIDGYLKRPGGLIYVADSAGNPAYMAALSAEMTFTGAAGFGAGAAVQVPVSGPVAALQIGDCVLIDRAGTPEAAQVTAINGNILTFATIASSHLTGCTIETGLFITEKRYVPKNRSEVVLAYPPVVRVVGGTGRYGYGRRGDQAAYNMDNFNLLASLSKFGGPPAWEIWPANTSAGIDAGTGMLWIPAGIMLAYYSEIKVRYVAGYNYANLPSEIKLACAQTIQALANNPQLGDVSGYKAGDTAITQISSSILSQDVKTLLAPWRARDFG